MADRILAAVRTHDNPVVVVSSMRRPVVKFNRVSRGRVDCDGTKLAFSNVTEFELPMGTKRLCIEELDGDAPLIYVEDAA